MTLRSTIENKRCLVTGGAGFIGSHLVDRLLNQGAGVTVVDDLSLGRTANLAHNLGNPRFSLVTGSVTDSRLLADLVVEHQVIFHLAAVVGVKHVLDDPLNTLHVNVEGTRVVLMEALKHQTRTVVVSSSEVYGKSRHIPFSESDDLVLGPSSAPRWSYAVSKLYGEHLAMALAHQGLPVTIVRYFNAYGPRLAGDGYGSVVAKFIVQALTGQPLTVHDDGCQKRGFTYVADTAAGTQAAALSDKAIGRVYNIGSQEHVRIVDLAQTILDLTGSKSKIIHVPSRSVFGPNFEDINLRGADGTRATQELGFTAQIPIHQGLAQTISWFKDQGY
ncbi:MAG: GDP-mannose 4,6-dehydratase [Deltaproteobacteria bacterium]|nr:GDP-mannose 4,6-dehydratase [Deltaproteobacteria bacterium]